MFERKKALIEAHRNVFPSYLCKVHDNIFLYMVCCNNIQTHMQGAKPSSNPQILHILNVCGMGWGGWGDGGDGYYYQVVTTQLHYLGMEVEACQNFGAAILAVQIAVQEVMDGKDGGRVGGAGWDVVVVNCDNRFGPEMGIEFGHLLMNSKVILDAVERGGVLPKLLLLSVR